jgi:hypothetical protein
MQLTPQFGIVNNASAKKYLRINTLSINATNWLNIGIFDAVVFGRQNQFELNYLQPFTFYEQWNNKVVAQIMHWLG